MHAPPSEHQDLSDLDDSEDEEASPTPGIPGGFPDRTQTASNVYY